MAKPKAKAEKSVPLKKNIWSERNIGWMLGVFAFLLYAQTIGFGYALDDVAVITGNNYVKDGFGGFGKILSNYYWHGHPGYSDSNSGLFRPLSLLMYATEWQIFGDKPGAFHFIHILLYALTSVQLFRWISEMLGKEGGRIALFATLLWIALPVHTEVVANLKSADEILSLLFSLIGLRLLLKWSNSNSMAWLFAAGASFFLALISKEAAVLVLPLALLMLLMFRQRSIKQLVLPGAVLMSYAVAWLLWHQFVISSAGERFDYDYRHNALLSNSSGIDQLGTAIGLQARYWLKMLVGYPLSHNYSFNEIPVNGFADIWPWISLAGIGTAAFFAWKKFRSAPIISFAILFYFVTMMLTSNVFYKIGDIFAERFTFIPSIGFCLLIAVAILRMGKKESGSAGAAIGIVAVLCLVYSVRTYARSTAWMDDTTLFLTDVENSPNSGRVHGNVGSIYMNSALADTNRVSRMQSFDMAFSEYSRAFEIDNRDYSSAQALGQVMYHKGDYKASTLWSLRSILIRRELIREMGMDTVIDDWNTLQNLGDAYVRREMFDSASHYYTASATVFPRTEIFGKMGDAHLRAGDTLKAIEAYFEGVKFDSTYLAGWDKIANLKGMQKDYRGSTEAFLRIAVLRPDDPAPWIMVYTNDSLMGDTAGMANAALEYHRRRK